MTNGGGAIRKRYDLVAKRDIFVHDGTMLLLRLRDFCRSHVFSLRDA